MSLIVRCLKCKETFPIEEKMFGQEMNCPHCNEKIYIPDKAKKEKQKRVEQKNNLPLLSMILGFVSLPLAFVMIGIFTAVPAVICGHISLSKIKSSGGKLLGQNKAIIGLVCGYVSFLISFVSIIIIICFTSIFIDGMSQGSQSSAIINVMDQGNSVCNNSSTSYQVVNGLRLIDISNCPADFQQAYYEYINAWQMMANVEQQAEQYDVDFNSGGALIESMIRGYNGDPFGKLGEAIQADTQLQKNYKQAQYQVGVTADNITTVARKHGVKIN